MNKRFVQNSREEIRIMTKKKKKERRKESDREPTLMWGTNSGGDHSTTHSQDALFLRFFFCFPSLTIFGCTLVNILIF